MKNLILAAVLIAPSAWAQATWTETFKLPEGITYRALAAGYDCGTFGNSYVATPESFRAHNIQFRQLAADKDLNKFLFEATFTPSEEQTCTYGVYLDRNRDDKTLDFTHSLIVTNGDEQNCNPGKDFLDGQLKNVAYEGSKRGLRYVAVEVIKDEVNDVCTTNSVRIVFDRRLSETL